MTNGADGCQDVFREDLHWSTKNFRFTIRIKRNLLNMACDYLK